MKQSSLKEEFIAAIDIGSNTLRLLIASLRDKKLTRKASLRCVTRLAEGVQKDGMLRQENIDKSITCLIEFKKMYGQFKVKDVIAVGTSALRDAKNSHLLIDKARDIIGINAEIISGEKEAEFVLTGVLYGLYQDQKNFYWDKMLVIDIGGGSTEWIYIENVKKSYKEFKKGSLPLGAIRLFKSFITTDPPDLIQIKLIKDYIISEIESKGLKELLSKTKTSKAIFIATGGTPTTVATIDMGLRKYDGEKVHLHRISRPTLSELLQKLINFPLQKRSHIIGLEPDRADIIITGTLILQTFMEVFDFDHLIVSDYGILEGVIINKKLNFFEEF
ncbi:MAG: Ppx/GppA family phosphatase [Thermodesulfovibrionales bacterium]|nr:Ppx/GppA family phosphatase [Thermodesulfovibrionales bacterium]